MGLGEVRRGRVGVLTDLLFVRVGDQQAVPVPQLPIPVQVKLRHVPPTSRVPDQEL